MCCRLLSVKPDSEDSLEFARMVEEGMCYDYPLRTS